MVRVITDEQYKQLCTELAQAQDRLEQNTLSLQVLKVAFDREIETRVSAQLELEKAREELMQVRTDLADSVAHRYPTPLEVLAVTGRPPEVDKCLATLGAAEAALADARRVAGLWFRRAREAVAIAHDRDNICHEEYSKRLEAEERAENFYSALLGAHKALDEYLARASTESVQTRISWLGQCLEEAEQGIERAEQRATRAEEAEQRAETLVQLVTPELASVLERLASHMDSIYFDTKDGKRAEALAEQIREALDDNQA